MAGGFTQLPNLVLLSGELDVYAKTLYALLVNYAREDEECWPGQDGLRKHLGCSERKLRDATRDLEMAGFISAHQRGRGNTNTYLLLSLEEADDRQQVPVSRGSRPAGGAGLDRHLVPVPCEQDAVEQDIKKKTASSSTSEVASDPDKQTTGEIIERPEVDALCTLLADLIAANGVKRPDPAQKRWRDAARLMIDRDGLDPKHIEWMIRWTQAEQFWKTVILSMPKLREKWAQVWLKAKAEHEKRDGKLQTSDQLREWANERT
jgi:hypothetical protein